MINVRKKIKNGNFIEHDQKDKQKNSYVSLPLKLTLQIYQI